MLSPGPVTFKAKPPAGPLPALATHALLAVEGPDAPAFLQAQLMNDVRTLHPGQWQWNGWLSAKGRVIALMALLRTAPELYLAVLPDFPADELRARLQRYVFRSKARLAVPEGWSCAAENDAVAAPGVAPDQATGDEATGWRLDMSGDTAQRALWLLPPGSAALAPPEAGIADAWFALDLAHGLPRLPAEGVEAWTPQMLSLERLRAFSLSKGCYPGQEIVARTHYLGKAKRGLLRLEGSDLRAGQRVEAAGAEIGQLASASPDGRHALAVATLEPTVSTARVEGNETRVLPLATGLARAV